ncbi:hypothetical protein HELRODRAFT_190806 [Helobdella robusta]|uniref:Uncharacterized protein n=1 Tax=Helobdella robusta TaxID=6412 RepID=T1FSB0_HELRO|nr:hypothetical protein HELRODRAFT_190806 [Helobdella robusta]ESO07901.1 hypothetical protein HELRODRAFT_190806 [Helobdella robusta]
MAFDAGNFLVCNLASFSSLLPSSSSSLSPTTHKNNDENDEDEEEDDEEEEEEETNEGGNDTEDGNDDNDTENDESDGEEDDNEEEEDDDKSDDSHDDDDSFFKSIASQRTIFIKQPQRQLPQQQHRQQQQNLQPVNKPQKQDGVMLLLAHVNSRQSDFVTINSNGLICLWKHDRQFLKKGESESDSHIEPSRCLKLKMKKSIYSPSLSSSSSPSSSSSSSTSTSSSDDIHIMFVQGMDDSRNEMNLQTAEKHIEKHMKNGWLLYSSNILQGGQYVTSVYKPMEDISSSAIINNGTSNQNSNNMPLNINSSNTLLLNKNNRYQHFSNISALSPPYSSHNGHDNSHFNNSIDDNISRFYTVTRHTKDKTLLSYSSQSYRKRTAECVKFYVSKVAKTSVKNSEMDSKTRSQRSKVNEDGNNSKSGNKYNDKVMGDGWEDGEQNFVAVILLYPPFASGAAGGGGHHEGGHSFIYMKFLITILKATLINFSH